VEPELAVALPAVGAACATALRPRPHLALAAGAVLGLGGFAAIVLSTPGLTSDQLGISLSISAPSRSMLIVAAAAVALVVIFAPEGAERSTLLRWGLSGLAGVCAIAVAPSIDIAVMVVLALAVLQAAGQGRRPYARRLRAPALAVALIELGLLFTRLQGPALLGRLGAVGLVAGMAAGVGALPYMHEFDPEEATATSPIPWLAFVGPLLAIAIVTHIQQLPPSAVPAFGAMLIGLGLLNMVWGSIASWRTETGADAWRNSFIADWGLALCGLGLAVTDGFAAALLVLYAILLNRLPLYLWSRQSLREKVTTERPINLLVAAALAGSAPFAGFPARILLLRGASTLYWPLALVLAASLLLWLPASLRLGRTAGMPKGRQLAGIAVVLAISVALGLYPQPLLRLAGL
jgi:hypothetical protein